MLNQTKSNIINAWKYFVILPALALFLMSFNVETIEVVKEPENKDLKTTSEFSILVEDNLITNTDVAESFSETKTSIDKAIQSKSSLLQKTIEIEINKNTTDSQLKEIAETLKKDDIDFSFKNVKRNSNDEITGINISYKDSDGNTGNYSLSSDNPINTFYFFKNENGSIGFKSANSSSKKNYKKWTVAKELSNVEREEMMKERKRFMEEHKEEMMKEREHMMQERMKMMEEHKAMSKERRKEVEIQMKELKKKHEKARKEHEEQRKMIIKERIKLRDTIEDKHSNIFIYDSDEHDENIKLFSGKNKALFIVDGEESDGKNINLLSPDDIARVNVLKGESAIKMYGERGKDGVIVITSKKGKGPWTVKYDVDTFEFNDEDFDFNKDYNFSYHFEEQDDLPNVKFFGTHLPRGSKTMLIKKSATDDYLKTMKDFFKEQNIDFKYSKLKRNKDGKITRIKVSLDDNNGNKSSSTFDSGEKGINPILIGKNNKKLTIKSI